MTNRKYKRKRNKAITIRMTEYEFNILQDKVEDSGLTQQAYLINAIKGATITSSDEVATQKEFSKTLAELVKQIRGLATNVNQMAYIANSLGDLPTADKLETTGAEIATFRKECSELWQSIRSSISQQNRTEQ